MIFITGHRMALLRTLSLIGALLTGGCASQSVAARSEKSATNRSATPSSLVAIFAHPDDETLIAPVLARYAREGKRVFLVIVTDGRLGAADHAKIPTGDSLATVRANEARCSARVLGIEPPILLGFHDAGLADFAGWPGMRLDTLATRVDSLLRALHPAAVITWGPEGGYGHSDHRLTGAAVTQVFQAGALAPSVPLFHAGFPESRTSNAPRWYGQHLHPVSADRLTTSISFTAADEEAAWRAIACHWSQASAEEQQQNREALHYLWQGAITFQQWGGGKVRSSLF
ncbi:MAG: PIG-L family deacetylase [Gemmatimonadaceae bacterium]